MAIRREERFSNLPIESDASRALKAATEEANEKRAKIFKGQHVAKKTKWVKLGLQPQLEGGGYALHIETFDGPKRVSVVIKKNLSPFAAREQLALHMSGLYAGF